MRGPMDLEELAMLALEEDRWTADNTTRSLQKTLRDRGLRDDQLADFVLVSKGTGIFSGGAWAKVLMNHASMDLRSLVDEGERVTPGIELLRARGPWVQVLAIERTLLNGLQYFSGIASQTRRFVDRVTQVAREKNLSSVPGVYHTRKILPLLREPVLSAVKSGGGEAHRRSLSDRILFKENHKYVLQALSLTMEDYVQKLRDLASLSDALIEVENLEEALELARLGVRHLLLDNFTPEQVRVALVELKDFALDIEISGGLDLEHIGHYVLPGVKRLSVGALTHSVPAMDISLDFKI